MKRLLRNRKAVSPVVSAVIMILVVMIAMSALFAFFVNYAADFRLGSGSAVLESVTIEDVKFTGDQAEIWVYNVGKVEFKISAVYVNGTLYYPQLGEVIYKAEDITSASSGKIREGAHANMTIGGIPTGESYLFKIVTARGTSVEGEYRR